MIKIYARVSILAKTAELDSKNKKLSTIIDVRNKFEKNSDVISKRGPMKAMHPINTMQKNSKFY